MPASTLLINLDKTYNIVLFKGLFNGEYINKMKGLGGPIILYRISAMPNSPQCGASPEQDKKATPMCANSPAR